MNPNRYPSGPTGSVHRSGVSGGPPQDKKWGDTTSKAGEVSRVFVGSVDYKTTTCSDIAQKFGRFGQILGIDINTNGFAFVQFSTVDEAQHAVCAENGVVFKNKKSEVKMFDKSNHPSKGKARDRSRSPNRRRTGGPTGTRHGTVFPETDFDDDYGFAPPPPPEPVVGNEAEIIVVHKDQWSYAEMIERRIRQETGIQFIDMLFLHSPTSLNLTLNDLFERRTLFAIVVTAVNEEHKSLTLHVLHSQTEHRNMPLEDAMRMIAKDYKQITGFSGPTMVAPYGGDGYGRSQLPEPTGNALIPDDMSYILKSVIQDGPQSLSVDSFDKIINYLTSERNRLKSRIAMQESAKVQQNQPQSDAAKQTLLENPHIQAALTSLLQISSLNKSEPEAQKQNNFQSNSGQYGGQNSGQYSGQNSGQYSGQYGGQYGQNENNGNQPTRRHPLFGTELGNNNNSIPGAVGGLVGYPPPQSYSHYGMN